MTEAVPREKIIADLEARGHAVLAAQDADGHLVRAVVLAAGQGRPARRHRPGYAGRPPVEVTHVKDVTEVRGAADLTRRRRCCSASGAAAAAQAADQADAAPARSASSSSCAKQVPLADLDDWLDFAEALVGRSDIPTDSLVEHFYDAWPSSMHYERDLPAWTGMDAPIRLSTASRGSRPPSRSPSSRASSTGKSSSPRPSPRAASTSKWAIRPGFAHAGEEDIVLAEQEPWFQLAEEASAPDLACTGNLTLLESDRRVDTSLTS